MIIYRLENYLIIGLFCAATVFLTTQACAPVSKAEKKNWKKERRNLTPEKLKSMVEEKENLESTLHSLREEIAQLQSQISKQEQQLTSLKTELKEVYEKLESREIELGIIDDQGNRWDSGVVFKVQIGAFSEYDFSQMVGSSPNMDVEEDNGLKQYVVGNFRDYWEADTFKKHLRKVGVNNAWIVPYKEGRRVPLKEVLERVID